MDGVCGETALTLQVAEPKQRTQAPVKIAGAASKILIHSLPPPTYYLSTLLLHPQLYKTTMGRATPMVAGYKDRRPREERSEFSFWLHPIDVHSCAA